MGEFSSPALYSTWGSPLFLCSKFSGDSTSSCNFPLFSCCLFPEQNQICAQKWDHYTFHLSASPRLCWLELLEDRAGAGEAFVRCWWNWSAWEIIMPASHFPDDKTEAQCGCIAELSGRIWDYYHCFPSLWQLDFESRTLGSYFGLVP